MLGRWRHNNEISIHCHSRGPRTRESRMLQLDRPFHSSTSHSSRISSNQKSKHTRLNRCRFRFHLYWRMHDRLHLQKQKQKQSLQLHGLSLSYLNSITLSGYEYSFLRLLCSYYIGEYSTLTAATSLVQCDESFIPSKERLASYPVSLLLIPFLCE